MGQHLKSKKLNNVCYEIRGPVLQRANELEEEGHRILKLNIGNPAPFGFNAPDEIIQDVIRMLPDSEGYSDSKGLYSARKAVMQECQKIGIPGVGVNDIYLGNGASELISMATQALLNQGDEVLIPAPDYPLWTAVVSLSGATPVHYLCDEDNGWQPSIEDIVSKITPNTKAIVIINPNNPTGAVYSREMLEQLVAIAEAHNLVVFADEIYSKILYDDAVHIPIGSLKADILCLTFNGLSKAYRLAGFRSGWLIVSGAKDRATDYIEGLNILSSMRLCANVPAQHAIQTALGGYQSINELILPGGRLLEQRDLAHKMLNEIPGVSCTKPAGAIYMFPRLDPQVYPVRDDEQLVLDLLNQEKILLVQGSGFNWHEPDHLRIVFLPNKLDLADAIERFANFLASYRKQLLLSKQA
ncbi:pyridoxal phosphate-dependent aminotransferase [Zhongshania sp.]|jgi:alanine-synthesizing transaminase|uniref:pyridoxal phosphate-dependent aminotransferase n=1 Tax=Zhongshania sp. TaxID=1971902 RepID=UPI001B6046E4|nr:pyridoxal phosphate-dependent aminotransferase [Zhongshania sp.]MBQ0794388.1 pyridoxal phosphate-dependent aminotransferase [Zhongshania sp.]|tara:strand:+ start:9319 stop:10557 length:1239 start_codon:yes stop_codon:yes gene_type:complete